MTKETEAMRMARMLEIIQISSNEWRIADRRLDENSGAKVIGFLQESDRGFESTRIGPNLSSETFATFDLALAYFAEPASQKRTTTPQPRRNLRRPPQWT